MKVHRKMIVLSILCVFSLVSFSIISSAAKRTLEVWAPGGKVWEDTYQEFQKTHPDIELKFVPLTGGFDERKQKLLSAVAGGVPPDVMWVDRFEVSQWAAFDTLTPLNKYIPKYKVSPSQYIRQTWDEAIFPWDNQLYALPWQTDNRLIFWNKDIFKEVGLNPDRFPVTWEEQLELNKKLTKFDDKGNVTRIGFAVVEGLGANGGEWVLGWANGGEYMTARSTKVTLNHPKLVETLDWLVKMTDASGGVEKAAAFKGTWGIEVQAPFFVGKIAAMINGNWTFESIARYAPNLNFGVAPIYRRDIYKKEKKLVPITFSGGHAFAIPKGAKNPDDAFEFIRWITGINGTRAYRNASIAFSKSMDRPWAPIIFAYQAANKESLEALAEQPVTQAIKDGVKLSFEIMAYTRFRDRSPAALLMQREFLGHARDEALYHKKTPKQALDDATKAIQAELDRLIDEWEKRTGKKLR